MSQRRVTDEQLAKLSDFGNSEAITTDLADDLIDARERIKALERVKYGTPCHCESWINACREAERERDENAAEVLRLRAAAERALMKMDEGMPHAPGTYWPGCTCGPCGLRAALASGGPGHASSGEPGGCELV